MQAELSEMHNILVTSATSQKKYQEDMVMTLKASSVVHMESQKAFIELL